MGGLGCNKPILSPFNLPGFGSKIEERAEEQHAGKGEKDQGIHNRAFQGTGHIPTFFQVKIDKTGQHQQVDHTKDEVERSRNQSIRKDHSLEKCSR